MIVLTSKFWLEGYAFDKHTTYSEYLGEDEFGRPMFETARPPMGEAVYWFKYKHDSSKLKTIMSLLEQNSDFSKFMQKFDYIVTIPPTNKNRPFQPVDLFARSVAETYHKIYRNDLFKTTNTIELKNKSRDEKRVILRPTIIVNEILPLDANLCIFDDVYDSGSTLSVYAELLKEKGFQHIYVFTLTKTKNSN